jgi:beta-phosphoglucomutase-like phosphatase (HAD superfamily)
MPRVRSQSSRTAAVPHRPRGRRAPRRLDAPVEPVDLDALSAHWRLAFNRAQDALRAAAASIAEPERRELARRLAGERAATAALLDSLARERRVRLAHHLAAPRPSARMLGLSERVDACVFELEGVLTGSASLHAAAWAETFGELLLRRAERAGERLGHFAPFNPRTDYLAHFHGRPRIEGVRSFLASRGIRLSEGDPGDPPSTLSVHGLANRKNLALRRRLDAGGVEAYAGSRSYLAAARDAGLRCAIVSASANTKAILERAVLGGLVDVVVDGEAIVRERLRGWPAPDVLLAACDRLGVPPGRTAVFETFGAGIAAGHAGRFEQVVAVTRHGDADRLHHEGASRVVADLAELLDPTLR